MNLESIDWDEDLPPASPEEEYQALRRAIQRTDGFGLIFVQCAPAKGHEIIEQIKEDLPQKKVEVLSLKEPIRNLYERVEALPNCDEIDVLFIEGLEYSIYEYEDAKRHLGWTTEEIQSYSWKGVPHILTNLNQQRESFRDNFQICFVFLVPLFVLKYLIHRAPDFFDWRSGVFQFQMESDKIQDEIRSASEKIDYKEYRKFTAEERKQKIFHIQYLIEASQSNSSELVNLYLELSNLFVADRSWGAAIASFDHILTIESEDYEVWHRRGIILLKNLEKYKEAIISFDKAIELNSNECNIWLDRGIALYHTGRYEEAITNFDKVIEINPDCRSNLWIRRGIALAKLGRYREAATSFEQAIKTKRDDYDEYYAWALRGLALGDLGQYRKSISSFDKAIKIDPNDYYSWYRRGILLYRRKKYRAALFSLDKAVKSNCEEYFIWFYRGLTLRKMKRYADALKSLDKAIRIDAEKYNLWNQHGILLRKLKRYRDAITSYDKALSINSDYYFAWKNRGTALRKLGRYEDAIESYDKALSIDPKHCGAWYGRAKALCNLGFYRQAIMSYAKAYTLEFWHYRNKLDRGITAVFKMIRNIFQALIF